MLPLKLSLYPSLSQRLRREPGQALASGQHAAKQFVLPKAASVLALRSRLSMPASQRLAGIAAIASLQCTLLPPGHSRAAAEARGWTGPSE